MSIPPSDLPSDAEEPQDPEQPPVGPEEPVRRRVNGFAIAALVFGILGWACCIFILAFMCASTAERQIRKRGDRGEGLVTAANVLSWIWVGVYVLAAADYYGIVDIGPSTPTY